MPFFMKIKKYLVHFRLILRKNYSLANWSAVSPQLIILFRGFNIFGFYFFFFWTSCSQHFHLSTDKLQETLYRSWLKKIFLERQPKWNKIESNRIVLKNCVRSNNFFKNVEFPWNKFHNSMKCALATTWYFFLFSSTYIEVDSFLKLKKFNIQIFLFIPKKTPYLDITRGGWVTPSKISFCWIAYIPFIFSLICDFMI